MGFNYFIGWCAARCVIGTLFRMRITGQENVPVSGGFILASNHLSYYDPPLVGCTIRRPIYFLAKENLFRKHLISKILTSVNALPVKRGAFDRRAVQLCVDTIGRGNGLLVFPEGTRSKTGELMDPKAGIGLIASKAACPVVPAHIRGSNHMGRCFWGKDKLRVTIGKPIPAEWIASQTTDKAGYLAIAQEVMGRIGSLAG